MGDVWAAIGALAGVAGVIVAIVGLIMSRHKPTSRLSPRQQPTSWTHTPSTPSPKTESKNRLQSSDLFAGAGFNALVTALLAFIAWKTAGTPEEALMGCVIGLGGFFGLFMFPVTLIWGIYEWFRER